jgi:hypothetical protein
LRRLQMKRRLTPILAVALTLLLFSGLACAVEKERHVKPFDRAPESMTEEEALKAELLDATEEHQDKRPGLDDTRAKKSVDGRSDSIKEQLKNKPRS